MTQIDGRIDGTDFNALVSHRANAIDASGIRRIFALAASLDDPINLSIGQPDFPVPEAIKQAAINAIDDDINGYTSTQGLPALLDKVNAWLRTDLGWDTRTVSTPGHTGPVSFITSGTSGALLLAFMVLLNPGDECIIADPYFVAYPHLATLCGAKAVCVDTYPASQRRSPTKQSSSCSTPPATRAASCPRVRNAPSFSRCVAPGACCSSAMRSTTSSPSPTPRPTTPRATLPSRVRPAPHASMGRRTTSC